MGARRPAPGPWDHWLLALGLGVLAAVGGGLLWTRLEPAWWALLAWIPAGLLVGSLLLVPASRGPILSAVARITAPVGRAVSLIVLAVIYWVLVTPLGLLTRMFGRDPLRRRRNSAVQSYWQDHRPDPDSDFRQY